MDSLVKNSGAGSQRGRANGLELLLQLSFPAIPARLKLVRPMVRASAQLCGFDLEDAWDVVLAVDEACANIIEHAYEWRCDAEIVISIFRINRGIQIQLRDYAPPVSPRSIQPRELDDVNRADLGPISSAQSWMTPGFCEPPMGKEIFSNLRNDHWSRHE